MAFLQNFSGYLIRSQILQTFLSALKSLWLCYYEIGQALWFCSMWEALVWGRCWMSDSHGGKAEPFHPSLSLSSCLQARWSWTGSGGFNIWKPEPQDFLSWFLQGVCVCVCALPRQQPGMEVSALTGVNSLHNNFSHKRKWDTVRYATGTCRRRRCLCKCKDRSINHTM